MSFKPVDVDQSKSATTIVFGAIRRSIMIKQGGI